MAKLTITDKLQAVAIARGYQIVATKSRKYTTYETQEGKRYHIGKRGALRFGRTITESFSCEGTIRDRWIAEYNKLAA